MPRPKHTFVPPSETMVADYAAGLGMPEPMKIARQFIACYAPEWRDTFNRPIYNWKMKFRQVWAKRKPKPSIHPSKPIGDWTL